MDTLILGLLMVKKHTLYDIRVFLKQGMYLMYSASSGSIQAAIKKLLAGQYISYHETVENGKNKKVYSITDKGKDYFIDWLNQPFTDELSQKSEYTKLFFTGFLPREQREQLIKNYISALNKTIAALHKTLVIARNTTVPQNLQDIAYFQHSTICLAVETASFQLSWYQQLLETIQMEDAKLEYN